MRNPILVICGASLALFSCASSDHPVAQQESVRQSGVSPVVYDKMKEGRALDVGDIVALSRARVSDRVSMDYIRDRGTVYYLSSDDVAHLRREGVSDTLIQYMADTRSPGWPYAQGGPYLPPLGISGGGAQ